MFDTVYFWMLFVAALIASSAIPANRVTMRAGVMALASIIVLGVVGNMSPEQLGFIVGAAAWIILTVVIAGVLMIQSSSWVAAIGILPILAFWILGKSAVGFELPQYKFFHLLGFSYFVVKAWTLLKDVQSGRLSAKPNFCVMGAYFFHFPTYFMGPMHLYGEFDKSIREPKYPKNEQWIDVAYRLALGLLKVKLLAPLLVPMSLAAVAGGHDPNLVTVVISSFVYSLVLYLDFSGYADLAIATGRVLGVATPENFRMPYLAPNIRDFWQRWHITFSRVLTSYVFIPLSRLLQSWIGKRPNAIMITGYLLTFTLCGYWHGATVNFLVWGLYHAVGLAVYDVYRQRAMKRRLQNKDRKPLVPDRVSGWLSVAGTFTFVSFGWILFVLPVSMWNLNFAAPTDLASVTQQTPIGSIADVPVQIASQVDQQLLAAESRGKPWLAGSDAMLLMLAIAGVLSVAGLVGFVFRTWKVDLSFIATRNELLIASKILGIGAVAMVLVLQAVYADLPAEAFIYGRF